MDTKNFFSENRLVFFEKPASSAEAFSKIKTSEEIKKTLFENPDVEEKFVNKFPNATSIEIDSREEAVSLPYNLKRKMVKVNIKVAEGDIRKVYSGTGFNILNAMKTAMDSKPAAQSEKPKHQVEYKNLDTSKFLSKYPELETQVLGKYPDTCNIEVRLFDKNIKLPQSKVERTFKKVVLILTMNNGERVSFSQVQHTERGAVSALMGDNLK